MTVLRLGGRLGAGGVLITASPPLSADDTGGSLHDRLGLIGPPAVVQAIAGRAAGTLQGEVQ
ncbi:methionyl-tRNA formyltransferase, partial [Pseudomonas ogarae]